MNFKLTTLCTFLAFALCGLEPVNADGELPGTASELESGAADKGTSRSGKYLRSNAVYNEPGSHLRLSRTTPAKGTSGQSQPSASDVSPPGPVRAEPASSSTPALRQPHGKSEAPKLDEQTPINDMQAAQKLLQQSLDATFYACDYLILTGVNSRQLSVQEELEVRTEMQGLVALNKIYAEKGYTKDTFNEIQRKLVILQLHIYTYGGNAITR